jgi:predicted MPP superfamily phosphohydrolase
MDKHRFIILLLFVFTSFHVTFSQDFKRNSDHSDNKLFSFGIIADVQYADIEKNGKRDYRNSLAKLEKCITEFNNHDLTFIISLGDLIDRNYDSYDKPLSILQNSIAPVYHVIGNHEFSVEDKYKKDIRKRLNNRKGYFDLEMGDVVFIILDGTAFSTFANAKGSKAYELAKSQYEEMEKQEFNNATTWNGGIGEKQYNWLRKSLEKADQSHRKVILFCHWPLLPENGTQLWNNKAVLDLINGYNCVIAWISGHHHAGHYEKVGKIHHLTINGMVEAREATSCGIMEVYTDKLMLKGYGDQKDFVLGISR